MAGAVKIGDNMVPAIDLQKLNSGDCAAVEAMRVAATHIGFAVVFNTDLSADRVCEVIETYRAFFHLSATEKARVDMAQTGANRGWGASGSEQVNPNANPDYKQFFDSGTVLPEEDKRRGIGVYAPNHWPEKPARFQAVISSYYQAACGVAMQVLRGLATAIGISSIYFDDAFNVPMALLRGNFYPPRPNWATLRDFGIATHTDYGCLTLLATDGSPGLEVQQRGGGWLPVTAPPGEFIINFGEMMERWTNGTVVATPHRVVGGQVERISVPLFFNPSYDVNIAPLGSVEQVLAGEHLSKRFNETYVHLQKEQHRLASQT